MCGRFQLKVQLDEIINRYGTVKSNINFLPQNEIFPSNMSPIIINDEGEKKIEMLKWGFTVSFTKKLLINARSETVSSKRTFRDSFINRRCLIPASSYYEWKKENGRNIKHMICTEEDIFSLAGIYKSFKDTKGNEVKEYSILTCPANKEIKDIHERMPVIINRDHEETWIDKKNRDISLLNNIIMSSNKEAVKRKKLD